MGINYDLALAQQYSINKDQIQTLVSQAVSQVERKVTLDMVFDTYKVGIIIISLVILTIFLLCFEHWNIRIAIENTGFPQFGRRLLQKENMPISMFSFCFLHTKKLFNSTYCQ